MESVRDEMTRDWMRLEDRCYEIRELYPASSPSYRTGLGANSRRHHHPLDVEGFRNALLVPASNAGPIVLIGDHGWGLHIPLLIFSGSGFLLRSIPLPVVNDSAAPGTRVLDLCLDHDDESVARVLTSTGVLTQTRLDTHRKIAPDLRIPTLCEDLANTTWSDAQILDRGDTAVIQSVAGRVWVLQRLLHQPAQVKITEVDIDGGELQPETSNEHDVTNKISKRGTRLRVIRQGEQLRVALLKNPGCDLVSFGFSCGARMVTGPVFSQKQAFQSVALSPSGKLLAAVTSPASPPVTLTVWAFPDNGSRPYEIVSHRIPNDLWDRNASSAIFLDWCGNNAVALGIDENLILIGPRGGTLRKCFKGPIRIWAEEDGLRVFGWNDFAFVSIVPEIVERVFWDVESSSITSQFLSLYLQSQRASDDIFHSYAIDMHLLLRNLRETGKLRECVNSLLAVADYCWDTSLQKLFLRGASSAEQFLHIKNSEPNGSIGNHARNLRVMNALRTLDIGIPVTSLQYVCLTPNAFIRRVTSMGFFDQASRLAQFCQVEETFVLLRWAEALLQKEGTPEEQLKDFLLDAFNPFLATQTIQLPYAEVSLKAAEAGKLSIANFFIRRETRTEAKVGGLILLGDIGEALREAAEALDTEVLNGFLVKVLPKIETGQLIAVMKESIRPHLVNRFLRVLRVHLYSLHREEDLRQILKEMGRIQDSVVLEVHDVTRVSDADRSKTLDHVWDRMHRMTGPRRALVIFEGNAVRAASLTAAWASRLERHLTLPVGTLSRASASELIAVVAIQIHDPSERDNFLNRLRRELRVPDRRYFWMCLSSLASRDDFAAMERLCEKGLPAIGYGPFVDACIRRRNLPEAVRYARMVMDLNDRSRYLARCGLAKEATDIALQLQDPVLLEEITELTNRRKDF